MGVTIYDSIFLLLFVNSKPNIFAIALVFFNNARFQVNLPDLNVSAHSSQIKIHKKITHSCSPHWYRGLWSVCQLTEPNRIYFMLMSLSIINLIQMCKRYWHFDWIIAEWRQFTRATGTKLTTSGIGKSRSSKTFRRSKWKLLVSC